MKRILLSAALLLLFLQGIHAQQDPHYSQYMFNGLAINPAYAGSREGGDLTLLGRFQWVQFEGAPNTQTLSFHSPFGKKANNGAGISLYNDKIGYTNTTAALGAYAFRVPVGKKATLALGLQGGAYFYRINWAEAITVNPGDPLVLGGTQTQVFPNFGAGAYFYTKKFYLGVSSPHLLNSRIETARNTGQTFSTLRNHYFLATGAVFKLNPDWAFKPSALIKYVSAAPVEVDFNAQVFWKDKIWMGASYRTGDAIVGLLGFNITPQLSVGYAYDYTITPLSDFNNGSHEIMLNLHLNYGKANFKSPRYF